MVNEVRRGMTLIELMLAITLGGMLLLGARMLFTQLQVADVNLGRAAREGDERANAMRLLHLLVRNAEVQPDSVNRFQGDTMSVRFRSHCQRPGGWLEACSVSLVLAVTGDSTMLTADLTPGRRLVLARWSGRGGFEYLDTAPSDRWVGSWGRSIIPPAAIAVALPSDTIVLPIAGR